MLHQTRWLKVPALGELRMTSLVGARPILIIIYIYIYIHTYICQGRFHTKRICPEHVVVACSLFLVRILWFTISNQIYLAGSRLNLVARPGAIRALERDPERAPERATKTSTKLPTKLPTNNFSYCFATESFSRHSRGQVFGEVFGTLFGVSGGVSEAVSGGLGGSLGDTLRPMAGFYGPFGVDLLMPSPMTLKSISFLEFTQWFR